MNLNNVSLLTTLRSLSFTLFYMLLLFSEKTSCINIIEKTTNDFPKSNQSSKNHENKYKGARERCSIFSPILSTLYLDEVTSKWQNKSIYFIDKTPRNTILFEADEILIADTEEFTQRDFYLFQTLQENYKWEFYRERASWMVWVYYDYEPQFY